jgi:5-formyltetrahydrofolate cyclo-ligase
VNSAELKRAKREIRRTVLAQRDALSSEQQARDSAAIAQRFLGLPEMLSARVVLAFWSFGSEPATAPLIASLVSRGIRVALPRIDGSELTPLGYEPGDDVVATPFGAAHPASGEPLDPRDLDVVLTPAVAFDRQGRRVGYGGGFYDRFFPRARSDATRVGICFEIQLLDGPLPAGHFDLRVGTVVTERETVRCRPSA